MPTPTNDFQLYACAGGANVKSQSAYNSSSARTGGATTGVADSALANKAWRQSSIMAAVIAALIVDYAVEDVIDDGTTATIEANLVAAIIAIIAAGGFTLTNTIIKNCVGVRQTVTAASTTTIDYSAGEMVVVELGTNITTLDFTNLPASGNYGILTLRFVNTSGGAWPTVVWPASILWPGGTPPTFSGTRNTVALLTEDHGTSFDGSYNNGLA